MSSLHSLTQDWTDAKRSIKSWVTEPIVPFFVGLSLCCCLALELDGATTTPPATIQGQPNQHPGLGTPSSLLISIFLPELNQIAVCVSGLDNQSCGQLLPKLWGLLQSPCLPARDLVLALSPCILCNASGSHHQVWSGNLVLWDSRTTDPQTPLYLPHFALGSHTVNNAECFYHPAWRWMRQN